MPNPAQSDLHINQPLTNVSVAYIPKAGDYIATAVFPKVPVQKQSDLYWKYAKSDWRRTDVQRRAPSTESPGVGWKLDTDSYFAHVYAVHKDIDDQIRANADSNFHLDSEATKFITNQMLLNRDIDWCSTYFKTGVWAVEYEGVAATPTGTQFLRFDNDNSDPIALFSTWQLAFRQLTGYNFNKVTMGAHVMKALKNHPDLVDRIKYTQRGVLTEELVASLLGVENVRVALATQATGPEINDTDDQDAAATYDFVANSKGVLLSYSPPSPSLMVPSAGYTFTWSGYAAGNSEGIKIKQFRQEQIASDRVEAEMTYDMKVVAPDMGVWLKTAVT